MTLQLIAVALAIGFLSAPLLAADPDPSSAKKEKRVCRDRKPTGSRLTVRVCHPQSEWDAIDKERQEQAEREVGRVQAMSRSGGTGFNPD
jgi:hypothetical protein